MVGTERSHGDRINKLLTYEAENCRPFYMQTLPDSEATPWNKNETANEQELVSQTSHPEKTPIKFGPCCLCLVNEHIYIYIAYWCALTAMYSAFTELQCNHIGCEKETLERAKLICQSFNSMHCVRLGFQSLCLCGFPSHGSCCWLAGWVAFLAGGLVDLPLLSAATTRTV